MVKPGATASSPPVVATSDCGPSVAFAAMTSCAVRLVAEFTVTFCTVTPAPAVTTVVPGLMRTGSHEQARFTGQAGKEFTWFALGASLPLISMDAERAAGQIIEAVRRRRPEIILTPAGQVVSRLAGLAPELTSRVLHAVERLVLPAPSGRGGAGTPGQELDPALPKKAFDRLTTLGRTAAARFNEHR